MAADPDGDGLASCFSCASRQNQGASTDTLWRCLPLLSLACVGARSVVEGFFGFGVAFVVEVGIDPNAPKTTYSL